MRSVDRDRVVRYARWTAAATTLLLIVLTVLVVVHQPGLYLTDQVVVAAVHATGRPFVPAARWLSTIGGPIGVDIGVGAVAVVLLYRRARLPALAVVAAWLLALGVETVLKVAVARPRPAFPDPVATASGLSFPSGHASGAAVLGASLLILAAPRLTGLRRAAVIACVVVAVLAIGASRVVLGVHNPSDVVGGFLLGIACAALAAPVLLRVRTRDGRSAHIGST